MRRDLGPSPPVRVTPSLAAILECGVREVVPGVVPWLRIAAGSSGKSCRPHIYHPVVRPRARGDATPPTRMSRPACSQPFPMPCSCVPPIARRVPCSVVERDEGDVPACRHHAKLFKDDDPEAPADDPYTPGWQSIWRLPHGEA